MDTYFVHIELYNFLLFLVLFQISNEAIQNGDYTIEIFDSPNYLMKGQFAKNLNSDMIIEYSTGNERLFYGIKKDGEGYFNGEYIKQIRLPDNEVRYESNNIFVTLNNSNDDNQYLLSFGANETVVELYDFKNGTYITKITADILGNSIFSYVFSLLELNNLEKEYLLIYIYNQQYIVQKIGFSSFNLDNISVKKVYTSPNCSNVNENRMIDGIIVNEEFILILFINGNNFYISIFDFDLNLKLNNVSLIMDSIEGFENSIGLFAKGINLKERYVLLLYYKNIISNLNLRLWYIKETFEIIENFVNNLNEYIFLSNPLLNKIIKINSQRCVFFGFKSKYNPNITDVGEISDSVSILLLDFYNEYKDLKIREYKIGLDSYKFHKEIAVEIFNNFICFTSAVYRTSDYKIISIFMIFGYFNQTNVENNITVNIYDYFLNKTNNIVDFIINNSTIIIENNIFGYELSTDNLKLVQIPEEIEFYNKNNENKLENGDILNRNYILKENEAIVIKEGKYFFEYQIIVQEPDYNKFNSYAINITDYHRSGGDIDQEDYFESQKFYGKISSVNFILYFKDTQYIVSTQYNNETKKDELCSYEMLLNNSCYFEANNNIDLYKKITKNIIYSYPEKGKSVVIDAKNNYVYQITTIDNEILSLNGSLNNNYNLSIIDLGDCGTLLKGRYNISDEQSLIYLKYEKITEKVSERDIQYEIYHPITKEQLNLTLCNNISIDIYIPITLPEETKHKYEELEKQGYDLFNPNDSFYNDICTPFKSENGTDVPANDRKIDYYKKYNNNTQCQDNCQYDKYLSDLGYLKCECEISDSNIGTEKIDKFEDKVIYESFYDILKNSNYKVVKCYNLVFNKDIIFHNYGSILVIIYFLIFICFLFYYIIVGMNPLKINTVKTIAENELFKGRNSALFSSLKFNNNMTIEKTESKFKYKKIKKESMNPPKKGSSKNLENNSKKENILINKKSAFNKNKKDINKRSKEKYKSVSLINNKFNIINNQDKNNNKSINNNLNFSKVQSSKKSSLFQKELLLNVYKDLDDFELNNLEYLEAIESDKRNFIQIYWSTLKREHIIIFTFFIRNDYNLVSIKYSRFIFLVCTDMAMNVFFFTDDSMHKVYKNYGKYDFVQQIPQIIYSTIVSQILEVFLCYLSLTDKHIYQIKEIKDTKKNMENIFRILKCVKIKIIVFYIFTFILYIFYWYLISSFCAVYQNTQIIFIKDSVSSFLVGLIYPFILYIFPVILRVISLQDREKKRLKIIFLISDIIPIF